MYAHARVWVWVLQFLWQLIIYSPKDTKQRVIHFILATN